MVAGRKRPLEGKQVPILTRPEKKVAKPSIHVTDHPSVADALANRDRLEGLKRDAETRYRNACDALVSKSELNGEQEAVADIVAGREPPEFVPPMEQIAVLQRDK